MRVLSALAIGALVGLSGSAGAVTLTEDITVWDGNNSVPSDSNTGWLGTSNPATRDGYLNENHETEPRTTHSQAWDLEGIWIDPVAQTLTMVGGYNFRQGQRSDGHTYTSGDIFIAVQGAGTDPTNFGTGQGSGNGYEYALDVNWSSNSYVVRNVSGMAVGATTNAYNLWQVAESQNRPESNPWRYNTGGPASEATNLGTGTFASYTSMDTWRLGSGNGYTQDLSLLDSAANPLTGATGLETVTRNSASNARYAVVFDLSGLDPLLWAPGSTIMYHFTQECGNDLLHGRYTNPSPSVILVPEPMTMGLLGLALAGLGIRRRMAKR